MMSTDMHAMYQSDTTFWAWDHIFFTQSQQVEEI